MLQRGGCEQRNDMSATDDSAFTGQPARTPGPRSVTAIYGVGAFAVVIAAAVETLRLRSLFSMPAGALLSGELYDVVTRENWRRSAVMALGLLLASVSNHRLAGAI